MKVFNIIIITILVLLLIYIISRFFFTTDIIYDIICDASIPADTNVPSSGVASFFFTNKNIISNKDFDENNTSNFMLSVWFYVDNWGNNIGNEKNILYIGTSDTAKTVPKLEQHNIGLASTAQLSSSDLSDNKNLNIVLDKFENNLFIDIETFDENEDQSIYTRYVIKNIPIQKWNCLTLSIDTKTFDVYLDGKLRNSFILQGIYKTYMLSNGKKKNIYIGYINSDKSMGFEGYITRIRYQPHAINPQEAYKIYKQGISSTIAKSIYNKYGLKVSFLEYEKEKGSFSI